MMPLLLKVVWTGEKKSLTDFSAYFDKGNYNFITYIIVNCCTLVIIIIKEQLFYFTIINIIKSWQSES